MIMNVISVFFFYIMQNHQLQGMVRLLEFNARLEYSQMQRIYLIRYWSNILKESILKGIAVGKILMWILDHEEGSVAHNKLDKSKRGNRKPTNIFKSLKN
jgi:hypothetical protein